MNDNLRTTLKRLKLSGLGRSLDVRLQEARANNLDHEEFLELVLQDETRVRRGNLIKRRLKAAGLSGAKTLDRFNWAFNHDISRKRIFDLAACDFIEKARDALFIGPPGVGKTHLAQAIALEAIKAGFTVYYRSVFDLVRDFIKEEDFPEEGRVLKRYLKPDLLIIDDMGLKQLPKRAGEHLFEVVMRRYEIRSTMMTSNRPVEEWGKLIGDVPTAGAILDRLLQHAEIISITGKSYRLKDQAVETSNPT
ncbi:MAG: ATP-binding protein [Kiritimatiellaeota bacterium]|nr:ATP-binding protein [Kiritimatiellota bacterium]